VRGYRLFSFDRLDELLVVSYFVIQASNPKFIAAGIFFNSQAAEAAASRLPLTGWRRAAISAASETLQTGGAC
jgi:hypothetical protein